MTINKRQKTIYSTVEVTEIERAFLRDLYNACEDVSEDDSVYEDLEIILEETIGELISKGRTDLSTYYDRG